MCAINKDGSLKSTIHRYNKNRNEWKELKQELRVFNISSEKRSKTLKTQLDLEIIYACHVDGNIHFIVPIDSYSFDKRFKHYLWNIEQNKTKFIPDFKSIQQRGWDNIMSLVHVPSKQMIIMIVENNYHTI